MVVADDVPRAATAKPEKVVPPSPPRIIRDQSTGNAYSRVGFLGEGGFARVFEVQDSKGKRKAVKVVAKSSIKSKKNKTKLWAEIKLHQMLDHPNIVQFEDCFEDEENVYMMLELCDNGSLMDLLRRRKRYSEPEARVILIQLIMACQYMHQTNVIHRDLKLGNLFLDNQMNVKVGDFGLAALIEKPGDRKKTICGTPNYIAPEVLFDTVNGHSFEVDIWSIGVILYTLLIGKPPFQTKDVKVIYKRIKENRYEFPSDKEISPTAQDLISIILNRTPEHRPNLEAIMQHAWFRDGPFPPFIPVTAHDSVPDFRHLTKMESRRNFEAVKHRSTAPSTSNLSPERTNAKASLVPNVVKQEKDFRYAVQPDSPVGALIQSARQPLVQAAAPIKEQSLLRKLTAAGAHATLSPVRKQAYTTNAAAGPSTRRSMYPLGEEEEDEQENLKDAEVPESRYDAGIRERELANQKARIVSQMGGSSAQQNRIREDDMLNGMRNGSPRKPLGSAVGVQSRVQSHITRSPEKGKDMVVPTKTKDGRVSLFETIGKNLSNALQASNTPSGYTSSRPIRDPQPPRVFIVSWLDYCAKYGMGWAMCDGTMGVHFNDTSTIALSPSNTHFDHINPLPTGDQVRKNYPIDLPPAELNNKVQLLKNFQVYIKERLLGQQPYSNPNLDLTKGMVFVARYMRLKHVIVFRLTNDVIQFNFYDHTKVIIHEDGHIISYIDKYHELACWSLEGLLRARDEDLEARERKRVDSVLHKLNYAVDVLLKIQSHQVLSRTKKSSAGPVIDVRQPERQSSRLAERPLRS